MATPETRVIVNLPSYREVVEEVKVEVLKLVGEKALEFQEEQFYAWLGAQSLVAIYILARRLSI